MTSSPSLLERKGQATLQQRGSVTPSPPTPHLIPLITCAEVKRWVLHTTLCLQFKNNETVLGDILALSFSKENSQSCILEFKSQREIWMRSSEAFLTHRSQRCQS